MYNSHIILVSLSSTIADLFFSSENIILCYFERSLIIFNHPRIIIMDDIPSGLTDEEVLLRAEEIRKSQEAKKAEELKRAEEIRKADEAKKAEELRRAEEIKKAEAEKKAQELKKAEILVSEEQARKAAEAKKIQDAEKAANLDKDVASFTAEKAAAEETAKKTSAKDEQKPKKSHKGLKIFGIILLLVIIFAGIVIISADVTITPGPDKNYPYNTNYNVWIPLDEQLSIGGYKVIALSPSSGDVMMISLGGVTYPLVVNTVTSVPDQIGTLTIFWGSVVVTKIQYEVDLTYLGNTNEKSAAFRMLISSDQQLPELLISLFLSSSGVQVKTA